MNPLARFAPIAGLDIGTSHTVVYARDGARIVREPSAVAYDERTNTVLAVGHGAKEMDGRAPGRVRVVRPIRRGTISDYQAAHVLVATLMRRAFTRRSPFPPRIVAPVPGCATDIECKAVERAVRACGSRSRLFVQQAVAAAVGARVDVAQVRAHLVVDIGGGTTEIAALGLGGVIALHSVPFGGDDFDRAIAARLAAERFLVGPLTAEALKIGLGFVGTPPGRDPLRVSGFDVYAAAPRTREVTETFVGEAIAHGFEEILLGISTVLEASPPEVVADLMQGGITLAGGGALTAGLVDEIASRINVRATIAPDPVLCVARGAAEIYASPHLSDLLHVGADRSARWYASLRIGTNESSSG